MHPYLEQAIAKSHTDDLHRLAARRRIVASVDKPGGRVKLRRHRVRPRPVPAPASVRLDLNVNLHAAHR